MARPPCRFGRVATHWQTRRRNRARRPRHARAAGGACPGPARRALGGARVNAAWLPLLEALCDPRIGALPAREVGDLGPSLLEVERGAARLRPGERAAAAEAVAEAVRERAIEWAS